MNRASVTMNGHPGGESDLVWERPWSVEEMRRASAGWSLGADAGLLLFLQDFSQRMLSRTHEIERQLDSLIQNTKATDSRLHSVFNDFLMLSNTQFIENRVYDDEVEETTPKPETGGRPAEPEKTREQKEAELIPKVQEAVRFGLRVLDSAFEQLDITAGNSDSEDEESGESAEPLLEPKDLYVDRPLPYLIGSQQFLEEEDVGLGDLSSEGSVGSDGRSVLESEEEKEPKESDDDFADESEEDEKQPLKSSRKMQLSDDEEEEGDDNDEDDEDSDLFRESEKEEDEDQEAAGGQRPAGQTSFVDELAARIQGDGTQQAGQEKTVSKTTEPAAKKREKTKKETQRKCEDEEDLFPAPRDDDDVQGDTYSPFGGRSGLFSGGQGLFDNEWEGDLFAEALKEEPRAVKTVAAPEPAVTKSGKKVPVGAVSLYPGVDLFGGSVVAEPSRRKEVQKERRTAEAVKPAIASGLFDDDDEDDLFGSGLKPKSAPPKPRTAAVLFEDSEDSGLFEPAVTPKLGKDKPKRKAKNVDEQPRAPDDSPPLAEKSQTSSGLFSDEDESQDLFSTNSDTKGNQPTVQAPAPVSHNPVSLFDDEDEHVPQKKSPPSSGPKPEPKSSGLFDGEKQGGWHGSEQRKPTDKLAPSSQVGKPSPDRQTTEKPGPVSPAHKKLSLFDNDSESDNDADLFGVSRRESQKKSHKVSLLFEDEDDLFGPARSAGKSTSPLQKAADLPEASGIFGEDEKKDFVDVTEKKEQAMLQGEGNKLRPVGGIPLFPGIDILEQKKQGNTKREPAEPEPSPSLFVEDVKSGVSSVVSLFDEEEDVNWEDSLSLSSQASGDLLSDTGVSTRVFQDEELLFSHHQQLDNDPDVDLFAAALKPELMKASVTGAREHERDEPNFTSVAVKPPPVHKREAKGAGGWTSADVTPATRLSPSTEHPRGQKPESERLSGPHCTKIKAPSSRIGKLQATLAFNPTTLLPGASPRIPASQGSASPSSPPGQSAKSAPSQEVGVGFDQPVQADTLHSVVKSRARVAGKRRPPTRGAHRLVAQRSDELEETDQVSELADKAPEQLHIPSPLGKQSPSEIVVTAKWAPAAKADPLLGARARPPTPPDALFGSDHLFSPSACQEPTGQPGEGSVAKRRVEKGPSLPTLAQDQGLYQPQRPAGKKLKPTPPLEEKEEEADDLFGTAKSKGSRKQPKAAVHRESKAQDIFEDDLFATESLAVTKRSSTRPGASSLFGDGEDIFADLSAVKPKEKRTKKKVETKSIFDDDMDDIFASTSVKKPLSSKPRASQPTGAPDSKTPNVFDDPLNVLGGQ
ncbi:WASH complex subunit 2 isoform X1 [Callorhinchus milii]|uniref:WASH complex subunit 2 isoform X1 n=1 Tax=Callorhinchus milii TaxID=7868 RepID=UPI001C3F72E8|nr:WASH complex subunit 2 isoform X1 [Callorhinchus milii]XP_042192653.1 WASH complex subunit 2 isoform X1 [Callorhinchus milii]XP_042192654.1 WASH complex subunit 2 isoform X1 [Callorhinchus milii]XP_042192655.1 WASH complex subunit 2 isoform X1 [Callorhinchus milii]XP_042192656.1 WASH complex subunit 2 isoform X1 [Callorhinchus milii]XP_042192657.1 WASH complex subunit 2 isoform X1 [Callorhinchus milii]XP_042192658.1 WASH complex subunit 2 isoform X1 [Callorhinchus milii]XP_042192660.1 WAS